jgi:preprotein translocase subunit SecA
MLSYIKKMISDNQERRIKKYYKMVEEINKLEPVFEQLTDEELKQKTAQFKQQLADGQTIFDLQVEAFAAVREAAKRVVNMRHFDVQLIGGLVLTEGNIAEMPTGEGKTLVASLPSYLRALEGKGVHVITVNDYLARRDRNLIGQIHEFLGLTVGLNVPMMQPEQKKLAYQADITYGVGNEFGFDHLRDRMVYDANQRVQRPYHYAIIDEVDSVLIDEAKTPLIIAGKTASSFNLHHLCAKIVKTFELEVHYHFDEETKATSFTDKGIEKIEQGFGIDNLYELEHQTLYHYMIQALRASVMFKRDVDYIVKEDKILLVDMFTGRTMEGRTLSNGLHQALEAKEGVTVTEENKTQASITIQNYFRLYPVLSGMTGTAKTEEKEFQELYGMDVVQIPTNRPIERKDEADLVFATTEEKYRAVAKEAKRVHETGQPILIGTTSILQSEEAANYLREAGVPYQILNAKSVDQEIELISAAGQKGHVTIATNMAGRGTDIKLGEGVNALGGLFVLGTERHESRRIDNQLKGRSGRQGDPGRSQFFISLEDDMFRRFAREELEKWKPQLQTTEEGLVLNKKIGEFVDRVQRICEGSNYAMREYNLKLDNVINEQRGIIYQLRDKVLFSEDSLSLVEPMITSYAQSLMEAVCSEELLPEEWDLKVLSTELTDVLHGYPITFDHPVHELEEVQQVIMPAIKQYIEQLEPYREDSRFQYTLKSLILNTIDREWIKHLEAMERLKEGIGLRSYSQEDPMRQYQREGLQLFTAMYHELEKEVAGQVAELVKTAQSM